MLLLYNFSQPFRHSLGSFLQSQRENYYYSIQPTVRTFDVKDWQCDGQEARTRGLALYWTSNKVANVGLPAKH